MTLIQVLGPDTCMSLQRHRTAGLKEGIKQIFKAFIIGFMGFAVFSHVNFTCLPLWMRFLRRTGVLPVVTHTPASVLL